MQAGFISNAMYASLSLNFFKMEILIDLLKIEIYLITGHVPYKLLWFLVDKSLTPGLICAFTYEWQSQRQKGKLTRALQLSCGRAGTETLVFQCLINILFSVSIMTDKIGDGELSLGIATNQGLKQKSPGEKKITAAYLIPQVITWYLEVQALWLLSLISVYCYFE